MEVGRLKTDAEPLDELLDGGIEEGVITNVYGGSGTGKTNVCIQAAVSCIDKGGNVLFVDTEGGFSPERFLQIYEDRDALEKLYLSEPTSFEEQKRLFDEIPEKVEEEDVDLVVVDSLVALYRIKLQDDEASEVNRELSRQLSLLSKVAREEDVPVLVTNQVYSSFDSDEVRMVGRDVPTYWSKCIVRLEKAERNVREAILEKHRSLPAGLKTSFAITNDGLEKPGEELEEDGVKLF